MREAMENSKKIAQWICFSLAFLIFGVPALHAAPWYMPKQAPKAKTTTGTMKPSILKYPVPPRITDTAVQTPAITDNPTVLHSAIPTGPYGDHHPHPYTYKIAADGSGNTIAVWVVRQSLYARRYTIGVGWQSSVLLSFNQQASGPEIAMDHNGNAIVVWDQWWPSPLRRGIGASHFDVTTASWSTPQLIGGNESQNARNPQIVADPSSGDFLAVWIKDSSIVEGRRYNPVTGWGETLSIIPQTRSLGRYERPETHEGHSLSLSVNTDGIATAVWNDNGIIRSAQYYPGGSGWTTPQNIGIGSSNILGTTGSSNIKVAMDAGGNAVAVWLKEEEDTFTFRVWSNRYAAGSGWGNPQQISNEPGKFYPADLAMDRSGNAIVVWRTKTDRKIVAARYVAGSGWIPPEIISNAEGFIPKIVMDSKGNGYVVWGQNDGFLWGNFFTAGSNLFAGRNTWNGSHLLMPQLYWAFEPSMTVDSNDDVILIWEQAEKLWAYRYHEIPASEKTLE